MKKLGWIGLGHMGAPMATNLLEAGYTVTVYNRSIDKMLRLKEVGAIQATSVKEVVEKAEIIFIMLSDAEAIRAIFTQKDGVIDGVVQGKLIVNMSTISPKETEEFAEMVLKRGGSYIDAPVSGSVGAAVTKQLLILAGGSKESLEMCQPYLDTLGRETVYFGETGKGSAAKLTINMLLGIMVQGFGETMVFGQNTGLTKEQSATLISKSALNNGLFQAKKESYLTEQFPAAFMLELMSKDLGLVRKTMEENKLVLPLAEAADITFQKAKENGKAKLDMAAVYLEISEG